MIRCLRFATIACALLTAAALRAQNTVFNAALSGDALNPSTYPAVTSSTTGWQMLSNKNTPASVESGGALSINMAGTSSGFMEAQALFASSPVQLLPGTNIELTTTFVPTYIVTNASDNLIVGLFNSGGVAPISGLSSSGLSSALTTFATGGAKGWLGYNANVPFTGASPKMLTRAAQTASNNTVQDVVIDSQSTSVGYSVPAGVSASSIGAMSTTLTNGSTYTLDYKLALSADGLTLTATVSLYNGVGITGTGGNTLIGTYSGKFTGTALLTKSFDALAFGWRADAGSSFPSTMKITALTVSTTGGAPWFTAQPPASMQVSIGSDMNLTASVGGTVSGYQWQFSSDGGATYTNLDVGAIPSAATSSLTVTNVQNANAGLYRLLATNAAGTSASTGTTVTVSSTPVAPVITKNPVGATVLGGTSYTFNVVVNGTSPLSYQWQKSTDGAMFTPIAGATAAAYAIASVSLADEGYYRVTITNVAGSTTSSAAQLVVNQPLTITAQPVGATLALNDSYTLSVTAVGKPAPTYQWYLNGAALSGATASTYTIVSASAANAGIYTVVASNTTGDTATSSGAAVAVLSPTLTTTATAPLSSGTNVLPDSRLTLTFSQPVAVGVMGTIKIYDAANATTPVDTIDIAAGLAQMKPLRAANALSTQALPVQTKTIGGVTNFNYYPITVAGSSATIYPRNGVLTYGHTYYVTIDAGVFVDASGLAFGGVSGSTGWTFTTKYVAPSSSATQFVVAADGSGDFCTLQAALDLIPANNTTPRRIYVRKGTYFEEVLFQSKHAITIVGEDIDQTAVVYPNNANFNSASGAYHRAVVYANSVHDCTFANLTVNNTTPQNGTQAEALIIGGSSYTTAHNIVTRCKFYSYQDTIQFNKQTFVSDTTIWGDVDFLWGDGPVYLQNCDIRILRAGAYFTQIRNGNGNHGYVFVNCRFTAPAGITGTFLGRIDPTTAGFPYSEVVVLDSKFGDVTNNAILNTTTGASGSNYLAGWWLLNNTTTAAAASNVHNWSNNLVNANGTALVNPNGDTFTNMPTDPTLQANYRNPTWVLNTSLAGAVNGSWTPALAPIVVTSPTMQTVDAGGQTTLSVLAISIPAPTYQWQKNGSAIPGATNASYVIPSAGGNDAGTYAVAVSNGTSTVTTAAVPLVVHGAPPVIALAPASTSGLLGTTATLNVWALGDGPFAYQWSKDGAPITGATSQSLRLTGLQNADAGNYSVAVTNAGGTTVSSLAALSIVAPATTVPTLPVIPAGTFDVTSYGAVGDGSTDNTVAIQAALNAALAAGGGTVEFPAAAGAYLSGPITVGSRINVQVDAGAVLQALPFGTYPKSMTAPSHFITVAKNATNIEFSGGGVIDGNGAAWWAALNGGAITNRPRLVQMTGASSMLFTGVTFSNSPTFHLAFSGANTNVTIYGVTISAPGDSPNTDGMDLAGTNFLVQGCSVSDGDDDIVAKPGSAFCRNIYVANCAIGTGHGVSIGGQTNVGLDGMVVTNCTFNGTSSALRFKADPTQGGPVQNVTFSNLTMTNVQYPILFYSYYNQLGSPGATSGSSQTTPTKVNQWNTTPPNSLASATIPTWKNVLITNLTVTNGSGYSTIWGLPLADALIANITLNNVTIQGGAGLELYDATNIQLTGTNSVGPIITCNALAITGQPAGKTVNVGDAVTFSGTAIGGGGTNNQGLTYQWNLNGAPVTDGLQPDGSTISGAKTTTLTITNARVTEAGNYTLTASTLLDGYNVATSSLAANSLPVSATSSAAALVVNPLPASISLSNLVFTYDGTAKVPTVTTVPANLPVQLAYDGGAAPVNAGSYGVTVTLADPNYTATPASATLTINPVTATVALGDLTQVYNGSPRAVSITTVPAGLPVTVTYSGLPTAPTAAGSYPVVATISDPNYAGRDSQPLLITRAVPNVTVVPYSVTYDGAAHSATGTASGAQGETLAGLDLGSTVHTSAGSYTDTWTFTDATGNYQNASGTVSDVIQRAAATLVVTPYDVVFDNQSHAAIGSAKGVNGEPLAGLDLSDTTHAKAGTYDDKWTFTDVTGNYNNAWARITDVIRKASGKLALAPLNQPYDGTPRVVAATVIPAGLGVSVTYDGAPAAPIYPGSYAVVATIDDPNYEGSTAATLRVQATAVVKDELAVAGELDGSVQLLSGVDRAIEANATITGDVLLPGAPRVKIEGHPTYAGVTDAAGATTPSDYTFALKGSALARYVVRRVDPVALPVVTAPATPVGTRNVTLNRASDPIGDFATLRNLTLNGNAGTFVLPPGVYDTLTVNGGSTLVLGDATATDPVVYELQQLKLNGTATVQLVGPVIVKLANGLTLNGTFGSSEHPEWLELRVWRDGVALNSKATLHGTVVSPNARVVINGGAALHGRVTASDLTINGNGMLSEPAP